MIKMLAWIRERGRWIMHVAHGGLHAVYFVVAFVEHVGFFSYVCGALAILSVMTTAMPEED